MTAVVVRSSSVPVSSPRFDMSVRLPETWSETLTRPRPRLGNRGRAAATVSCSTLRFQGSCASVLSDLGKYAAVMVNPESDLPPYRQVADIIARQIESGELAPGQRVPSITTLVQTYGIAKNTAIRALNYLEKEGLVVIRQGWGTFVRSQALVDHARGRQVRHVVLSAVHSDLRRVRAHTAV